MCNICINNAMRIDPSRTLTLRNKFCADLVRRYKRVIKAVKNSVYINNAFGIKANVLDIPIEAFAFERDSEKIAAFMVWFKQKVQEEVFEVYGAQQVGSSIEPEWANIYVNSAYQRGMLRGNLELQRAGFNVPLYSALEGGVTAAFFTPVNLDRAGVVYTRVFEGLNGINAEMSTQISRILAQGILEGKGPLELAREITDRVNKIGITRAKILARTELIRAHHLGTVQEYRNWGVLGVKVLAEWTTAQDGRVCDLCKPLQGKIFTLNQIEGMIPKHPQCRCVCIPLDITDR